LIDTSTILLNVADVLGYSLFTTHLHIYAQPATSTYCMTHSV
jgi:hypothetical protein